MADPSEAGVQGPAILLERDLQSEGVIFRREQGLVGFGLVSVGMWMTPEWVMADKSIRCMMNMVALRTCLNPGYEVHRDLEQIKPFVKHLWKQRKPYARSLVDRIVDMEERLGIIVRDVQVRRQRSQRRVQWNRLGAGAIGVVTDSRLLKQDITYINSFYDMREPMQTVAADKLDWLTRDQTIDQYVASTGLNRDGSAVERLVILQRIAKSNFKESTYVSPLVFRDTIDYLTYVLRRRRTKNPMTYEAYLSQKRTEERKAVKKEYAVMAVRFLAR